MKNYLFIFAALFLITGCSNKIQLEGKWNCTQRTEAQVLRDQSNPETVEGNAIYTTSSTISFVENTFTIEYESYLNKYECTCENPTFTEEDVQKMATNSEVINGTYKIKGNNLILKYIDLNQEDSIPFSIQNDILTLGSLSSENAPVEYRLINEK